MKFSGNAPWQPASDPGNRDAFTNGEHRARVHDFHDGDYESDVVGDTSVVTFRFEMTYERSGERYYSTGRDLWVFRGEDGGWIAVWRTMLEVQEQTAS